MRHFDQFKSLSDSTCAPRGCGRSHAGSWHRIAQHQINHHVGKAWISQQTNVRFRCFLLPQLMLCGFNRPHHRRDPFGIFINANTKINFLIAWIFFIRLHQCQNFICRLFYEILKHYVFPVAMGKVGNMPHSVQLPSYREWSVLPIRVNPKLRIAAVTPEPQLVITGLSKSTPASKKT